MENYDPTIEGQWLQLTVVCFVLTSFIEQYRKTITVDGQLDMVCTYLLDLSLVNERKLRNYLYSTNHISQFHPLLVQLEVLDTAGAEQFTSLNEVYIKVATSFNTIPKSSNNSHQSGRGFVLVFRSKFLPTYSSLCLNHLTTAWHKKQAYKKWTTCGIRSLGSKGLMWCVVENSTPV